jgi:hypothetical protein
MQKKANMQPTSIENTNATYVSRWFVDINELSSLSGCTVNQLEAFIAEGICPGPIYAHTPDGTWWSAIGEYFGRHGALPSDSKHFYAPAAAWWIRRAVILNRRGLALSDIAVNLSKIFEAQFLDALAQEPLANQGFPDCFDDDILLPEKAKIRASLEWADWISGGFGVCLHHISGSACVAKGALAAVAKARLETGEIVGDEMRILDMTERLSALMLPFAPWERAEGTPGKTIDRFLALAKLGHAGPYNA